MPEKKNHEEIQSIYHSFRPRVYYRVKNKKNFKLQGFFNLQGHFSDIVYFTGSI